MIKWTKHTTLFRKYLSMTLAIILASFLILGIFLMIFVLQYWKNYETDRVRDSIQGMSSLVADCVETSNGELSVTDRDKWILLSDLCNSYHYELILVDSNGKVVKMTRFNSRIKKDYVIPEKIIYTLASEKYYEETTNTGNFYSDTEFVVAVPVKLQVGVSNTTAGYVIACSSNSLYTEMPGQIFSIFIYAVFAALIVSGVLAGVFSYSQSKPLIQMSEQAKKLSKGDFSGRIRVKGKDELGRLIRTFNDMADALEKEEQVRRDFIANISHELKTPMTTIAGFIDGILDGTIPPERQSHYLRIVSEEIGRLSELVASMLSLARIDSGKTAIHKTSFLLLDVLFDILMTFEDRLSQNHIEVIGVEQTDGITVYADRSLFHQVFYNLIENAVKFTPENGIITIFAEVRNNRLYFSVKNTGKGISDKDLPFIFDKFYKTDKSRSKDKKSMGLGLYIVKTIVKLHGGDVSASSELNGETCFSGWIPEK
ncbi:MAG: HAMP domain-containing histidine kinase [Ruminococcus sp.]|nr:HAMP domain-containing histidine kinase [Ruminococcus sp.]